MSSGGRVIAGVVIFSALMGAAWLMVAGRLRTALILYCAHDAVFAEQLVERFQATTGARIVEEISKEPQVQERMTHTIADLMNKELDAKGVIVVLEAEHSCMTIRGVKKPGSVTITSAVRGLFKSNESSRAEAMALINQR